jgi:hypothetical protein
MFCIVLRVLNAVFIYVSLSNFVMIILSFLLYVKVTHFDFRCCGSMSVFCLCEAGCFIDFVYIVIILCIVFIMFSSFSLASLGILYVFNLFIM